MSQKKIIIKCIKPANYSENKSEVAGRPTVPTEPIVLIDSSYFSFYRAHATRSWYVRAHPDDKNTDWVNNPKFMKMYESKFREHVGKIAKTLRVPLQSLIFVRDCRREEIWRTHLFPAYKAHRSECEVTAESDVCAVKNKSNMGPVIKYSNDNILSSKTADALQSLPVRTIRVPGAEADDIIAVLTVHYNRTEPGREVWIIANDKDFHQLLDSPCNKIFKIGQKYTLERINPTNSSIDVKVLCGDKTDGIPPIFSGCGPATATGLVNNPTDLATILDKDPQAQAQYALNRKLIDFREIPKEIADKILFFHRLEV